MRFTKKSRLISALESTAMADIIFLLLIFFLLSSSFILQTGVKVDLPQVTKTEPQTERDVVVTLNRQGELFLDGVAIPWPQFRGELEERLTAASHRTVIVKGDAEVSLGRTVEVMDIARQVGAEQLAIAARSVQERERR
ncbi:MAG: biopolymer transporter ExbD [Candidatus Eisenbacteria bacterium]|nr:biopolymer transporter ExbD [Candidatus Eisenbacteria bacterium]